MYDPNLTRPMRDELTSLGVEELDTSAKVDAFLSREGTALVFFNSVCGCAAGSARPGLALSLKDERRPDHVGTVFAGMDVEAVAHLRTRFSQFPPSSPSVLLLRDGEPVRYIHRTEIEIRDHLAFAELLSRSFGRLVA